MTKGNQILYDKVISLTLYRKDATSTIPVYKVFKGAYAKSQQKITGKDIYVSVPQTYKNRGQEISFYEGSSFTEMQEVYNKERDAYEQRTVTLRAHGSVYKYKTLEQMQYGVHPDGTPLKTGDKCYVIETGQTFCVRVLGDTHNFLTSEASAVDVSEANKPLQVLRLECPMYGVKPDITFRVSLVPGQNCYQAVVKVRNLNVDAVDIRDWEKMVIKAGYRNGDSVEYVCPIFSSYVESPNPDGVTVFEGITVGRVVSGLTDHMIEISFISESVTIQHIMEQCAKVMSANCEISCAIPDEIMQTEVFVQKNTVYAENGLAVLNWLQTTLTSLIKTAAGPQGADWNVSVQYYNECLYVMLVGGPNKIPDMLQNVIKLNSITSAVFNGTALTVEAPWNPALKPGDLFFMPPNFKNGSKLPNALDISTYTNKENLYRVLTMTITFGTVESTNSMQILSVPAQYTEEMHIGDSLEMNAEYINSYYAKQWEDDKFKQGTSSPVRISIGEADDTQAVTVEQVATGNKMFDEGVDVYSGWGGLVTITIDKEITGNCLSLIAQWFLTEYASGPKLEKGKRGKNKEEWYYLMEQELKNMGYSDALLHFQENGIPSYVIWWPLIATATYWARQKDLETRHTSNYSRIDLSNPDAIENGKNLAIPIWPGTWSSPSFAAHRDLWKEAYLSYKDKYGSGWNYWWRAMYLYLGGSESELE